MAWVATAIAGAGLLVSTYSSISAGKAQQRAADLQRSAIQSDQAFRQQQYDDYRKNYGPMEQEMLQKATSEQPLNLGPTWAKIQSNFDTAGRNNEASMARKGMLGSGLDKANNLEGARAFTLSDAFSKGIQNRDALRERLLNAGKNMPQQAGFVAQGNQNMSNFWGQQAGMYANAAGQAGQGISQGLGALGYAIGNYSQAPQPTVNTNITMPQDNLSPIQPRPEIDYSIFTPAYSPGQAGPGSLASSPITGPLDR